MPRWQLGMTSACTSHKSDQRDLAQALRAWRLQTSTIHENSGRRSGGAQPPLACSPTFRTVTTMGVCKKIAIKRAATSCHARVAPLFKQVQRELVLGVDDPNEQKAAGSLRPKKEEAINNASTMNDTASPGVTPRTATALRCCRDAVKRGLPIGRSIGHQHVTLLAGFGKKYRFTCPQLWHR